MDKLPANINWIPLAQQEEMDVPIPLDILLGVNSRLQEILITSILASTHHRVHVIDNGNTAIQSLHQQTFHLCLFSYDMPELNAIEASKSIRSSTQPWAKIPIIGLVEEASNLKLSKCISSGMNTFICAPLIAPKITSLVSYYENKLSTEQSQQTNS